MQRASRPPLDQGPHQLLHPERGDGGGHVADGGRATDRVNTNPTSKGAQENLLAFCSSEKVNEVNYFVVVTNKYTLGTMGGRTVALLLPLKGTSSSLANHCAYDSIFQTFVLFQIFLLGVRFG